MKLVLLMDNSYIFSAHVNWCWFIEFNCFRICNQCNLLCCPIRKDWLLSVIAELYLMTWKWHSPTIIILKNHLLPLKISAAVFKMFWKYVKLWSSKPPSIVMVTNYDRTIAVWRTQSCKNSPFSVHAAERDKPSLRFGNLFIFFKHTHTHTHTHKSIKRLHCVLNIMFIPTPGQILCEQQTLDE